MQTIHKTVTIDAPPARVWQVLTDDRTYRVWAAEFAEGSRAETDWAEGSPALFTDGSGSGLLATIAASRVGELLDIEFVGVLTNGREDTTSDQARAFRGAHETYRLAPQGAGTHLVVDADMEEEHVADMSAAWDRALARIELLVTAE